MLDLNDRMSREISRVGKIIGREGRMTERFSLAEADGEWARSVDSLNALIDDLVRPITEVARVIVAVAEGDLNQKMALKISGQPVKGEFLRIGTTVNTMVEQLRSFSAEVTRVAREVGTEGKLGGQAEVAGVSGTWARPDGEREPDGREPDRSGAQHRAGHDRRGAGRPEPEDHGRGQG